MNTNHKKDVHKEACIIANPIYNAVFKRLMRNERIAKYFFSVLFGEKITEINLDPNRPIPEKIIYDTFRIDFWGKIQTDENKDRKLFIEVLKTEDENKFIKSDYLYEKYTRTEMLNGSEVITPMATVYIIGFEIKKIETPCLALTTEFRDEILGEKIVLSLREPFGHTTFVIQTKKINDDDCKNPLDELLSIFKQDHFAWENTKSGKYYLRQVDNPEMKYIIDELHEIALNPDIRQEIETEEKALCSQL
jgi:hypothetical protein